MRKKALSELFDEVQNHVQSTRDVSSNVLKELNDDFPAILNTFENEQKKVKNNVAPVLVLGLYLTVIVYLYVSIDCTPLYLAFFKIVP